MKIKAHLAVTVRDNRTGELLSKHRQEVHSFVRQFIDLWYRSSARTSYGIVDIAGVTRTYTQNIDDWGMTVYPGHTDTSIVVGTGDTAVTISDYSLESMIADGSAAGELVHQAANWVAPATIGSRRRFLLNRTFNNQSGGTITVKEAGVYLWGQVAGQHIMILRDTLDTPEAIPHNASAVFQYECYVEV